MRSRTFRASLVRSSVKAGVLFAVIAAAMLGHVAGAALAPYHGHGDPMSGRPFAAGSPAAVIAAHDCWTGPAPTDMAGKIPGHVVVELPGGDGAAYGGARLVGQALDQVFNHEAHGLTVYAFCR